MRRHPARSTDSNVLCVGVFLYQNDQTHTTLIFIQSVCLLETSICATLYTSRPKTVRRETLKDSDCRFKYE